MKTTLTLTLTLTLTFATLLLLAVAQDDVTGPVGAPGTAPEGLTAALARRDQTERRRTYTYRVTGKDVDVNAEGLELELSLTSNYGPMITGYLQGSHGDRYKLRIFIKRLIEYTPDNVTGFQRQGKDTIVMIYPPMNLTNSSMNSTNTNTNLTFTNCTGNFTGNATGNSSNVTTNANCTTFNGTTNGTTNMNSTTMNQIPTTVNWQWTDFVQMNNSNASATDRMFTARTMDWAVNITFRVNPPAGQTLPNTSIAYGLNDLKFDINLNVTALRALGFFANNNTDLAIVAVVQSAFTHRLCESNTSSNNATQSERETGPEGAICANDVDGSAVGFLRWVNTLGCNGTTTKISDVVLDTADNEIDSIDNSTLFTGSRGNLVTWTLPDLPTMPNGTCNWDPIFHLDSSQDAQQGSATALAVGCAWVFALIAIFFN